MTVFETIASTEQLAAGWRRVRRNALAIFRSSGRSYGRSSGRTGAGDPDIACFGASLSAQLGRLQMELLTGRYRPGRLRPAILAKPGGGERHLAIPPVRDRVVQTAASLVMDRIIDPRLSDASFAFRRGRSVAHAVGRVTTYRLWGSDWVLDGDIERYFDTIPHDRLMDRLRDHIRCARTLALVRAWLWRFAKDQGFDGCGVAQGSPISPLLANLYLDPIDRAIDRRRTRLVRYADDFVVLCQRRSDAERAQQTLAALLAAEGLRLHPDKTRVTSFAEGFEFLGYRFLGPVITSTGDAALRYSSA